CPPRHLLPASVSSCAWRCHRVGGNSDRYHCGCISFPPLFLSDGRLVIFPDCDASSDRNCTGGISGNGRPLYVHSSDWLSDRSGLGIGWSGSSRSDCSNWHGDGRAWRRHCTQHCECSLSSRLEEPCNAVCACPSCVWPTRHVARAALRKRLVF